MGNLSHQITLKKKKLFSVMGEKLSGNLGQNTLLALCVLEGIVRHNMAGAVTETTTTTTMNCYH